MSAHESEERLMTVFADVHYYFSAPTPRPAAHRFDKGSYFYFYGNKSGIGGRLEIANNVGKPEQDAFTGSMESTTMRQSHKHPTLCTIVVDGYGSHHEGTSSSVQQPEHHWRLPNTDPRNEGKYLFRLHTLDIYFWTAEDANTFVAFARKKLEIDQLDIVDVPSTAATHDQVISPVVQNLENVAIQDPAYHNGQTRNSRTESTDVKSTPKVGGSREETEQGTPKAQIPTVFQPQDTPKAQIPMMFQPLAYNPAAPPAPEPIKHREKTPPPVDAEVGTGLAAAALRDHSQATSPQSSMSRPPYGHPQSSGLFNPQPAQLHTPSFASPAPSTAYAKSQSSAGCRASSVSSFPPPPPQIGRGSVSPYTPIPPHAAPPRSPSNSASTHSQQVVSTFSAPPQDSMAPFYGKDSAPLQSPATEILGDSYVAGVRQPLQHLHPQYADYTPPGHEPPVGGYSDYQYNQQQQQHHHHHQNQGNEYDVHGQVYRPTEEEAHGRKPSKPSKQPQGKLEQGVENVDKKVNRFFKKLEKKIG
ncbi:MAG: hypothetical protein ASARMPREDX12_005688 [Alectoria sarmentosa]|nr:MAG: hypothetical protein ASARMPREDX12_005688 [Alectoria sarmentosa]CAD6573026.1 MAG: hypothetical protein ASARMPRED_005838 [Alectoria sarmentosa]